jgi:hypothetical protein
MADAQINGSAQGSGSLGASMTGLCSSKTYLPVRMVSIHCIFYVYFLDFLIFFLVFDLTLSRQIQARSKLKVQNPHIKWSGAAWICAKELRHYPAFFRNGTTITVSVNTLTSYFFI